MKATDQLIHDHKAVVKMLEIMEAVTRKLDKGENVDSGDLEAMLTFLRVS